MTVVKDDEVLIPDEFFPDYSLSEDEFRSELERRSRESQDKFEKLDAY